MHTPTLPAVGKAAKFYVVWVGARPGIYLSWPEANAQVAGWPAALYKSFKTRAEAEQAFRQPPTSAGPQSAPLGVSGQPGALRAEGAAIGSASAKPSTLARSAMILPSMSVDAACSGNPGRMEYQGVDTETRSQIFHQAFELGTNNIGEFLALVHGLAWCKVHDQPELPIYSDSKIALGWIAKKQCKTTLPRIAKTAKLYELIERGELWLQTNTYRNALIKWPTERWGEIPADFGRK